MSFACQQETYLNVRGEAMVLDPLNIAPRPWSGSDGSQVNHLLESENGSFENAI